MNGRDATLLSVCVYESIALVTKAPTISALIKRVRHRHEVKVFVGFISGYLAYHLLLEEF